MTHAFRRTRLLGLVCLMAMAAPTWAQVDPVTLLPNNTSIFARIHGGERVSQAWLESAAHRAIVDSGLWGFVTSLVSDENLAALLPSTGTSTDEMTAYLPLYRTLVKHVAEHGLVAGADVRILAGEVMIVLPNAANSDLAKDLDALARKMAQENGVEIQDQTVEGRSIAGAKIGEFWLGWWKEGDHLVVAGNQLGPNPILRRLKGNSENLTKSTRYARFSAEPPYTVWSDVWFDAESLIKLVPQAVPEVPTILQTIGSKSLLGVRITTGFENQAMRTDWSLLLAKERTGLVSLVGQPPLDLEKLPKLPADVDYVYASSLDAARVYDSAMEMTSQIAKALADPFLTDLPAAIGRHEEQLGFKIRDVLGALGDRAVIYSSPTDGPFVLGLSMAVAVKDRATLEKALDRLAELAKQTDSKILLDKKTEGESVYWIGGYAAPGMPFAPTIALSNEWLVATLVAPSAAARFFETQGQSTGVWSAAQMRDKFPAGAGTLTGVIYSDPRPTIRFASSFLPLTTGFVRNALPELKFDLIHAPRPDVIADSAFPGFAATWSDERGVHCTSRYSLPLTNPELGLMSVGFFGSAFLFGIGESSIENFNPVLPGAENAPAPIEVKPADNAESPDMTLRGLNRLTGRVTPAAFLGKLGAR